MPDRTVEILDRAPLGTKARVRMSDAAGWLHVWRPSGHRQWCLAAVELDGDTTDEGEPRKHPIGLSAGAQITDRRGLTNDVRRALDDAAAADRERKRAA